MKHSKFGQTLLKGFALVTFCLIVFSGTAKAGGDTYEIYLNNKLILRQFVLQPLNIKDLPVNSSNINDKLVIIYRHCGIIGKERSIMVKDNKGNTLKRWMFPDASGSQQGMVILVKDVLLLEKKNNKANLHIFYTSQQLPDGRMLASI